MKILFDKVSYDISKLITQSYSTSFSKGISLLDKSIQPKIFAIYSFVRLADEIVDSFQGYPQARLLTNFISNYRFALDKKISINPVLNAFQKIVHEYDLFDLVDRFLESMKMDLNKSNYNSYESYQNYIHGSAEVVGLMCLKIFVGDTPEQYESLKPYAIKLGSAFQKVNFLRDIHDDMYRLERMYFPNVDWNQFTEKQKMEILTEIKVEFDEALIGIKILPKSCKLAVFLAYSYYSKLLKKLNNKSCEAILKKRTRVSNLFKIFILLKATFQYKLGMI